MKKMTKSNTKGRYPPQLSFNFVWTMKTMVIGKLLAPPFSCIKFVMLFLLSTPTHIEKERGKDKGKERGEKHGKKRNIGLLSKR